MSYQEEEEGKKTNLFAIQHLVRRINQGKAAKKKMNQHNWSMIPMNTCDAVNLICWKSKNKQCEKRGRGEVWGPIRAGGTVVQMLQRSSEADNVLPRLPSGLDYSGASSSGSDQSRFCRDQLFHRRPDALLSHLAPKCTGFEKNSN